MIGPVAAVRTLSEGACVAHIAKGIQQLIGMRRCASGACRIVNKTGRTVVVRSKYKDVWEGEQWRLAEGGEMVVPPHILKDGEPYSRLGAFIDDDPAGHAHPLYIGHDEQWRLAEGAEMLVPPHILKNGEPYSRLGAFIGEDVSLKKSLPLYIGSHHFLTSHEITLTLSPPLSTHLAMLSN